MRYIDLVGYEQAQRDYFGRMNKDKYKIMEISKIYDKDYWDGDRKYGYGGYTYDGRWKKIAKRIIKYYKLKDNSNILDFGCGKGYLLYELKQLNPTFNVYGIDISKYAIDNAKEEIKQFLVYGGDKIFPNLITHAFDLVISLGTLHNLPIYDLKEAIQHIDRIGIKKYITMESFRNDKERTNLFCWALTAESYFSDKEWSWLLKEWGYTGDYGLFFFE